MPFVYTVHVDTKNLTEYSSITCEFSVWAGVRITTKISVFKIDIYTTVNVLHTCHFGNIKMNYIFKELSKLTVKIPP